MTPKTLTIIGAGNVGKTLGLLWTDKAVFTVQDVLNRSIDHARDAVDFIGSGTAVTATSTLRRADVYLIGTPDDAIRPTAEKLAASGLLTTESVVFHCSGARSSNELQACADAGASIASIHPLKSFASPRLAVEEFAGTFCGVEGDASALTMLEAAFSAIGARMVEIDPQHKSVYHAAAVFASNYLVTMLDVAAQTYGKAGIPQETAMQFMEPLVRGAIDNVFRLGPAAALTGPIARGDMQTAAVQYQAIHAWDENFGALYKQMAKLTADLARRKTTESSTEDGFQRRGE